MYRLLLFGMRLLYPAPDLLAIGKSHIVLSATSHAIVSVCLTKNGYTLM